MLSSIQLTDDEFGCLTWTRPGLSQMTVQAEPLQRHCPLDNGRLQPRILFDAKDAVSPSSIGDLEALPLEIIYSIFETLDLQTLTDFRVISWRARALVDSFPPYNAILQYCPDALRALLSTHMALNFIASDIFEALCTQSCFGCGQFGPFLDMFIGRRHCITCIGYSDNLLAITASSARRLFGLNLKAIRKLPTLLSIPGQYAESEKRYRRRISLVRFVSAAQVASEQQEELNALHRTSRPQGKPLLKSPQLPPYSRQSLPRFDGHKQNPYRFMAMIRIPFLNRRTGNQDWGVSCQACRLGPRYERRGYYDWNTLYTVSGYLEHFQKCELSQIGREMVPRLIDPTQKNQYDPSAKLLAFFNNFNF